MKVENPFKTKWLESLSKEDFIKIIEDHVSDDVLLNYAKIGGNDVTSDKVQKKASKKAGIIHANDFVHALGYVSRQGSSRILQYVVGDLKKWKNGIVEKLMKYNPGISKDEAMAVAYAIYELGGKVKPYADWRKLYLDGARKNNFSDLHETFGKRLNEEKIVDSLFNKNNGYGVEEVKNKG